MAGGTEFRIVEFRGKSALAIEQEINGLLAAGWRITFRDSYRATLECTATPERPLPKSDGRVPETRRQVHERELALAQARQAAGESLGAGDMLALAREANRDDWPSLREERREETADLLRIVDGDGCGRFPR